MSGVVAENIRPDFVRGLARSVFPHGAGQVVLIRLEQRAGTGVATCGQGQALADRGVREGAQLSGPCAAGVALSGKAARPACAAHPVSTGPGPAGGRMGPSHGLPHS